MRQSRSLIKALEAAAEVLTSDSRDLKDLAEKAAARSGIPAERILMNIDLNGIDLTGKPVEFLLDKGAKFRGAKLTAKQLAEFRKSDKKGRSRQTRRKIRSMRVELIADFIEVFEQDTKVLSKDNQGRALDGVELRQILLDPLGNTNSADQPLDEGYAHQVLLSLVPFASKSNLEFFSKLFQLLGDLHCPFGQRARGLIFDDYLAHFGPAVGRLIGQLQPSEVLDAEWITNGTPDQSTFRHLKRGHAGTASLINLFSHRAEQINEFRLVHPNAIEQAMDLIHDPIERLDFLETAKFECNGDQAERIALRVVNDDWPISYTRQVLEADVPASVRSAIYRQILHQGNTDRTLEMLRWLNNNRGAVGALSLDDALANVDNFSAIFEFGSDILGDLGQNQINVLRSALNRTATNESQRARAQRLLRD